MRYRITQCIALFSMMALIGGLLSCGTLDDSDESDHHEESVARTYTLSGTVSHESSVSRFSVLSNSEEGQSTLTMSNLMIVFQNQHSEKMYSFYIESDGSFEVDVEVFDDEDSGDTFMAYLVQKDPFRYLATLTDTYDSGGSSAVTGLTISESIADLLIELDSGTSMVVLTSNETLLYFDDEFVTRVSDDQPVGVASSGKGELAAISDVSSTNQLDPDEDGLPNIFDAMDNGQDLDNTNGSTRLAAVAGSSIASYASMFMNYKIDYDQVAFATVTNNAELTIEVVVDDASQVSSIVADSIHTSYTDSTTTLLPVGFTEIDTFPSQGTEWSSTGYALYHAQNFDGQDIWTVFLKPNNNDFEVGDMIRLKATLTDGSVEYYWVTIHFKFQSTMTDTTSWIHGGSGTASDPFCILDTGGRVFTWGAPKDETGSDLTGLAYDFELFFLENSRPESVVHEGVTHVQEIGEGVYRDDLAEATIDTYATNTPSVNMLQVDIKGSYEYGDNTALKIYMTRKAWGASASCPD